jgi:hypothetical protein
MQARGGVTVRIGRGRRAERSVRDSDAAMLAGGGESCADIEALRAQERPFGAVPSDSTTYRTFRHRLDPATPAGLW